ncbi:3050_t:CDS:2 [Paraglomus occultum]|uniref:3050_t:CDS:1 n=1 Tax=Paraglomus occultum TaxID=144539 RepID=A0A9N9FEP6_9GLOM|nr:3050_t:CDS:2 [Paraglomus occultum]
MEERKRVADTEEHLKTLHLEDASNLTVLNQTPSVLIRVNEAFDSASGKPFAKENFRRATRWLHFRGLVVSELSAGNEPTLAQQIVRYLKNEVPHGFRLCIPDGNTVVLKGILLLPHSYFNFIRGRVYPHGLAKNWVKRAVTTHTTMVSPPAIKRPEGAAPKRKPRANYKSINDDLLKDLLSNIMKERLQEEYRKLGSNPTQEKLEFFKKKKAESKVLA